MWKSKKNGIGVDVGTMTIKLVSLKQEKDGIILDKVELRPIPALEDDLADMYPLANHSEVLNELVSDCGFKKNSPVSTSVAAGNSVIRFIELDQMTEEQITETLHYDAEKYVASDTTGLFVDFQILAEEEMDGYQRMHVLVVAAKQETIDDYVALLSGAGLKTTVVDIDLLAVVNSVTYNYDIQDGTTAIIHVGFSSTSIAILKEGRFVFSRTLPTGGNGFIETLCERLDIEEDVALKIMAGEAVEGLDADHVTKVSNDVAESITSEIKRSFDFFEATRDDLDIENVFISGGMSSSDVLTETISKVIDRPAVLVDPFKNISLGEHEGSDLLKNKGPALTVAVGLALRGIPNAGN